MKIIICLQCFLPPQLTHAADLNKNSSKYLLYDIAPGNRVGALSHVYFDFPNKFLKFCFELLFLKDLESRKDALM